MESSKQVKQAIALEAYEELAERYSQHAEQKAENGYIEHPAMRKQIGAVEGLCILEAGCGPGFLSKYLYDHGAERVVSFDVSPKMIEFAQARIGKKAECHVADMAQPLGFLKENQFDLVVSSLAIDYVLDWSVPLNEFYRSLKKGGRLIFSIQHPLASYNWYKPKSDFGVQLVEAYWRGFGGKPVRMPDYYRSFSEVINPLLQAGFQLKELVDARPIPELREYQPERYKRYEHMATFMVIEANK